jgi:hypothetical protein
MAYLIKVAADSIIEQVESSLIDETEDSFFDPIQPDPDCINDDDTMCYELPQSTIELDERKIIDATCSYGGDDPDQVWKTSDASSISGNQEQCSLFVDKHWGSDSSILHMREKLRRSGSGASSKNASSIAENRRPPIFLMPGLASTRLVAWRFKSCPQHALLSDIKVQDYVWLNINLVLQMSSISYECFKECISLGQNQSDMDDIESGCKLRPDEGLDAISSLSPGGIGSTMLIGGTNTVYAWLIQWLADNLGYDVTNIGKNIQTKPVTVI